MIRRTLEQIGGMCKAEWNPAASAVAITGAGTDSRKITAGQLFVPLVGDKFDGHDYVAQALKDGAAAALWQRGHAIPPELADAPLLLVDDTLAALQALASVYRTELAGLRVVGITGSNGKTTTKDMVAAVLGTSLRVHKTAGNLNNHIGLPLMVLELDEQTEVAVLEMGMSGFGEIELLTQIAKPDVAIITNIGDAHMLQLGSREGIAKAKLEIVSGLQPGGLLLYNGDEPLLVAGLGTTALPAGARLEAFGLMDGNRWTAANMNIDAVSAAFELKDGGARAQVNGAVTEAAETAEAAIYAIPVPGKHNVSNALAAIAIGHHFGISGERIRQGLSSLQLTGMRIQPVKAFNGAMILNDAYNANPTAVRAAIDLLESVSGFRKKWIVLGDMLELGPDEEQLHYDTGAFITPAKADAVLTCGQLSRHTSHGVKSSFGAAADAADIIHFEEKEKLAEWLKQQLQPADIVLVKGSRGMRMEQIVQALEVG
ncbi:UDP-N-acetylmuramoyl-tripeptide--D-alanyl-D-alanine ligase [Paenibacillus algorifonticola]|uniref:UDP-N-acetylmuramoyl-tripeptide--D-alanyl-D-alanine ligase n=1 Tax=Paenibacillus algorifonticola TaxID=684063 RepID=A0A1I1XS22_9BACL|nr:UDP-N-acetylmuramoyl-tripeptide--D-alanyl-D-alanine ligase [Paenibacillus algorifonticola]SFE10039.1 UDP-N-acetylmuramoyl-tripeptide--D-alanyl-D-alanine ligase [Paenibacillus algorifonticola]